MAGTPMKNFRKYDKVIYTEVMKIVEDLAKKRKDGFTSDDIRAVMDRKKIVLDDYRRIGRLLLSMWKQDRIRGTGEYVTSKRRAAHGRSVMLFVGADNEKGLVFWEQHSYIKERGKSVFYEQI